jgi:hypothetical protein
VAAAQSSLASLIGDYGDSDSDSDDSDDGEVGVGGNGEKSGEEIVEKPTEDAEVRCSVLPNPR